MKSFRSLLLFASLAIAACSTPKLSEHWPGNLPPLTYYTAIYDSDAKNSAIQTRDRYLLWVVRFYTGWKIYESGWFKITAEVLGEIEGAEDTQLAKKNMAALGLRIGAEWAKKHNDRFIRTGTVAAWGEALRESIERGEELSLMTKVANDLDMLEQGLIPVRDIEFERYYPDAEDEDDFF
jgi:hypothetical protein